MGTELGDAEEAVEIDEAGKEIQTSIYKISKSWISNMKSNKYR